MADGAYRPPAPAPAGADYFTAASLSAYQRLSDVASPSHNNYGASGHHGRYSSGQNFGDGDDGGGGLEGDSDSEWGRPARKKVPWWKRLAAMGRDVEEEHPARTSQLLTLIPLTGGQARRTAGVPRRCPLPPLPRCDQAA